MVHTKSRTQYEPTMDRGIAPNQHFPVSQSDTPVSWVDTGPLKKFLFITLQIQEKDLPDTRLFGKEYAKAIGEELFDPAELLESAPVCLRNIADESGICLLDVLTELPESCWLLITELRLYEGFGSSWLQRSKPKIISKFICDFMNFNE
ncbi:MAG: hypothetical protein ABIK15_00820 [Pseudomonadota bacterium]